jgi:hypothetical protein
MREHDHEYWNQSTINHIVGGWTLYRLHNIVQHDVCRLDDVRMRRREGEGGRGDLPQALFPDPIIGVEVSET